MNLFGWQDKYFNHFHEYFPSYLFGGDEAIDIIKKCMHDDKPYHAKPNSDRIY